MPKKQSTSTLMAQTSPAQRGASAHFPPTHWTTTSTASPQQSEKQLSKFGRESAPISPHGMSISPPLNQAMILSLEAVTRTIFTAPQHSSPPTHHRGFTQALEALPISTYLMRQTTTTNQPYHLPIGCRTTRKTLQKLHPTKSATIWG